MKKVALQAIVAANITPTVNTAKHRIVDNAEIDTFYANAGGFQTGDAEDSILGPNIAYDFPYQIQIWKEGGTVYADGWFINQTGNLLTTINIARILNDEYYPNDVTDPSTSLPYLKEFRAKNTSNTEVRCEVGKVGSDYVIRVKDAFPSSPNRYKFSTFWKTKN